MRFPGRPSFYQAFAGQRRAWHWPGPFAPLSARQVIVVLSIFYLVVALAVVAFDTAAARDDAWGEARETSGKAAAVFAERSLRTITATRAILDAVRTHVASVGLDAVLHSPDEWQLFHDLAQGLPENGSLWINAPDGRCLFSSFAPSPPAVSAAGRDFLSVHADHLVEFFLGGVIRGRWSGRYNWPMSVALRDNQGRLVAVLHAAILADYFTPLLRSAGLGDDAILALFRADGTLLLRQPVLDTIPEGARIHPTWLRNDSAVGTKVAVSSLDGVERLYAYRHLPEYDVYAAVGISTAQIGARWHGRVARLVELMGVALAPMLALSLAGLRGARREESARLALADANRLLERRVIERTREAEAARLAAERANRGKSRFLAAASHDLRQPSQATRLFVEMLRDQCAGTPLAPVVEKLHESTSRSEELLTALMTVATLDAGAIHVNREVVEVAQMMGSLHDEWAVQARAKSIDLRTLPVRAVVHTDGVLLKRALGNLLANAIRYTPRGRVLFGCRRTARGLRFEVYDTGVGIPPDQLDAIFEDFLQLRRAEGAMGLGLGLGIVKRTADLLGLEVSVRSCPGKGSCFSLLCPCPPVRGEGAPQADPQA